MKTNTRTIADDRSNRRRVRIVDDSALVRSAADKARVTGEPVILAKHGGGVPNNYGYPARTDCVVVVAVPHDDAVHVAVYATTAPANKVSLSGVLAHCVGGFARPLLDERYGENATRAARSRVLLAACADLGLCGG